MSQRKRILVLVDWYLPGFKAGGPIRSVANIVNHLRDKFDFSIITSDTDLQEEKPYDTIQSDEWLQVSPHVKVHYISKSKMTSANLKMLMLEQQADVIYLNSMFSRFFTILPLRIRNRYLPNRRVVIAPRGMLGKGALDIKPLKKKIFLSFAKITGLYKNVRWHASSEHEAEEIRDVFGKNVSVNIALNLTAKRELVLQSRAKESGKVKAVFLSRISTKKNLDGTLRILAMLPSQYKVDFDIYGPVEDEVHWETCRQLMHNMPEHIHVEYKGAVENDEVNDILNRYHLSILLTFNENFGHSIIESMAAGCPVLISDQTPWKDLASRHAGWEYPVKEEDDILKSLIHVADMDQQEFNLWSRSAFSFAEKIIHDENAVEQNVKLFL